MTIIWKMTNHTKKFSIYVRYTPDTPINQYAVLFSNTPDFAFVHLRTGNRDHAVRSASNYYEACMNALQGR